MNAQINLTKKEMNRINEMNFSKKETEDVMDEMKKMNVVAEDCNCSVWSMGTVAMGILLAVGAVVYSLIAM